MARAAAAPPAPDTQMDEETLARMFPYRKQLPTVTIDQVREALPVENKVIVADHRNIIFDLEHEQAADRNVSIDGKQVAANSSALGALSSWIGVPTKFIDRVEPDMKQWILTNMFTRNQGEAAVVLDDGDRIVEVRSPGAKIIRSADLLDRTAEVVGEDAQVCDYWCTPSEFRLDLIVHDASDRAIGGDRQIGDITRGGLRVGHDKKNNLAPWVHTFMYRLVCTNGLENIADTFKIDMRGSDVEEVLANFEHSCELAFAQVEREIEAFYELRNQPVPNPERVLARMAQEQGMPPRTLAALVEMAPTLPDNASMFDVVNLVTHYANEDSVARRDGSRRLLQGLGGTVVSEHAARCGHCQAKLN